MCKFSLLMCTYNSEKTVETAIRSCQAQTCRDWELLILDNASADSSADIVKKYAAEDDRIVLYSSDHNVGWAKGTSILLEKTSGKYMCFLAADDYLASSCALEYVSEVIDREDAPPVILVKHTNTTFDAEIVDEPKESLNYISVRSKSPLFKLTWAVENWFYNSLFHFLNIEFLRKENVDFFDPYLGDNDGMTRLLLDCEYYCGIYNTVYALTSDTSQTMGAVVADGYYTMSRWNIIKDAIIEHCDFDTSRIVGISDYIVNLGFQQLFKLCAGCPVRDLEMNNKNVSNHDRYRLIQEVLMKPEINELMAFCGPKGRVSTLFENVAGLCNRIVAEEGFTDDDWLYKIVSGLYELEGEPARKSEYSYDDLRSIVEGLISENNPYCFGFTEVNEALGYLHEDTLLQICRAYGQGQMMIVSELESMSEKISENPDHRKSVVRAIRDVCDHISGRVSGFFE